MNSTTLSAPFFPILSCLPIVSCMRATSCVLALLLAALLSPAALAQDARQIVEDSQKRHRSNSQQYEGVLEVTDAKGKKNEKRWQFLRRGSFGDSQSLLRFTAPPLVKGVALLIHNHPDRASDQWMWTPELQRDRRIALQDRSTRFFGTDFSFEDLEERDVNQSDYALDGEETLAGHACYKITSTPRKTKSSQYSKVTLWIRKDIVFPVQLEMYRKEKLVRRLQYRRVEKVQGVWTAQELEIADLEKGSRTTLRTEKLQNNLPLAEDLFTLQALRRGE